MVSADKGLVKIILPYVVHNILLFGEKDDREDISKEIMSVIDHDIKMSEAEEHSKTTEHAQTIFCLIDDLKRWFDSFSETKNDKLSNVVKKAEDVINSISLGSLAVIAFNHSAFSRSLMYYEEFIRDQKSSLENLDRNVRHNLQRIYSQMKD